MISTDHADAPATVAPAAGTVRPPPLRDRLTSPGGLFVSAVMLVAAFPVTSAVRDPDFWWHLRSGQLILQRGGLLTTDPFTYTAAGHAWTMHEWLIEVLFAGLFSWGGLAAIVAVLSAVTWLGLVCIAARARLDRPNPFVLGGGMLLAVLAGYPIWGPRAQMVTFALACVALLLADHHLRRGGRLILLLVPIFVLWSNLHSGFVIGLGFIAVIVAAEAVAGWLSVGERAPRRRVRTLALVLLGCLLASAINLNGPGVILYPVATQGSVAQQSLIAEWHSPDFHDWTARFFAAMLLSLVGLIVANRRIRPRDAALVVVAVVLALQSVRHIVLFVAAATPVWICQADLAVARLRAPSAPDAARLGTEAQLLPLALRALSWAVLCGAVLILYVGGRLLPVLQTREDSLFYAQDFPLCAATWLAADPEPLRIFNQYGEGGYLAHRLSAQGDRVFIFGDAALMGDALLYRYGDVEQVAPQWDRVLHDAGTDVVVFDTATPLANVLSHASDWVEVYADRHNMAFAPRDRVAQLHLAPRALPTAHGPNTCTRLRDTPLTDQPPSAG